MVKIDPEAADRIRRHHPLQYGFRGDDIVFGSNIVFDPGDDATVQERYNRCPTCEQWAPCDVRKLLEDVLKEQAGEDSETGEPTTNTPQSHLEQVQQHLTLAFRHLQELGKLRPKRILDPRDPRDTFDVFILYADDRIRQVGDYITTAKEYLELRAKDE